MRPVTYTIISVPQPFGSDTHGEAAGNCSSKSAVGLRMTGDGDKALNRKAQADALAERDRVWRNSLDILVVADADGVFRAVSPAWTRVLGHDVSEVVGHSFRDFVLQNDAEQTSQAIRSAATGIDVNGFENRYRHKDGSPRLLAWRTSEEDGLIYGYARDVTVERAQAAELAKRVAERERLWSTNPMLFAVAAYDSTILEVNPAWTTLLGWTPEELVGRSYAEYVHPDDAERSLEWASRLARGLKVEELKNRYRCKDGGSRWIAWAITADNEVFHCVGRDITETRAQAEEVKALEASLRQSQKMEAVGRLTGGIAHDFNNMLTGVICGLDIIQRRLAAGRYDDVDRFVDAARECGARAASLVKRLMAFSRQQPLKVETIDVKMLVGRVDDLLRQTLGPGISLTQTFVPDLWLVSADTSQLENALLNLSINARDAMPDGGRLTVALQNVRFEERDLSRPQELGAGDYVAISVGDTGIGMSQNIIDRAFDPFFTTKEIGKGTGLGLSMIYGFAKQSHGHVAIASDIGRGTTITLYLPRSVYPVLVAAERTVDARRHAQAGQTVLVVDDEPAVRLMISEVLTELGFAFAEAADADAALTVLRSEIVIDLLITDIGLPGMNGWQMSEVARKSRPELKVIFVTGYTGDIVLNKGSSGDDINVITKPFKIDELMTKILSLTVEEK